MHILSGDLRLPTQKALGLCLPEGGQGQGGNGGGTGVAAGRPLTVLLAPAPLVPAFVNLRHLDLGASAACQGCCRLLALGPCCSALSGPDRSKIGFLLRSSY